MSQTSIPASLPIGFAGMKADTTEDTVETFVSAEASAEIPFGVMVAQGTGDRDGKMPAAGTDKLVGIVLHSHDYAKDTELGSTGLKPKTALQILRKGKALVTVEEAVAPGDRAHIRYASGAGGTQKGAWRKSSVANETIDATTQCVFRSTASANGLAEVEIDMVAKP